MHTNHITTYALIFNLSIQMLQYPFKNQHIWADIFVIKYRKINILQNWFPVTVFSIAEVIHKISKHHYGSMYVYHVHSVRPLNYPHYKFLMSCRVQECIIMLRYRWAAVPSTSHRHQLLGSQYNACMQYTPIFRAETK